MICLKLSVQEFLTNCLASAPIYLTDRLLILDFKLAHLLKLFVCCNAIPFIDLLTNGSSTFPVLLAAIFENVELRVIVGGGGLLPIEILVSGRSALCLYTAILSIIFSYCVCYQLLDYNRVCVIRL